MKTYLTYGFGIAIANALVALVLFFAGMHNDPAKVSTANWIAGLAGLAIYVAGMIIGLKTRRAEVPADKPFGYGQALGSALMISLFAVVGGILFQFAYDTVINPGMIEATMAAQRAKMEAKGLSDSQIDNAMTMMRKFQSPVIRAIFSFIFLAILDTIVSLIIAAFFTRKDPDEVTSL